MLSGRMKRPVLAGLLVAVFTAAAVAAQGTSLALLGPVQAGRWELREVGARAPSRQLCVADVRMLLQVRHAGASCSQVVLSQSSRSAVVNYTCPRLGHGRTEIIVDNNEQVRLETQGIADGAPFDVAYDARRLGTCAVASPRALTAR